MSMLVGCDPEGFFVDKNGAPVPIVGLLGGGKGTPIPCKGGGYLEDGTAFEINITPAATAKEFLTNIKSVMAAIDVRAKELDMSISIEPTKLFQKEQLLSEQANESGCLPDYNAWERCANPRVSVRNTLQRFASGNIHVSWEEPNNPPDFRERLVQWMDVYLGLPEIILEKDKDRRKFYGKAGSFRPKSYGIEWRTGSNFWLKSDARIKWAFDSTHAAFSRTQRGSAVEVPREVQQAINNHDVGLAKSIVSMYSIKLPKE